MTSINLVVGVAHLAQEVHIGIHCLQALRDDGIPVVGSLWPMGVERGSLVIERLPGELKFTWDFDDSLEDLA